MVLSRLIKYVTEGDGVAFRVGQLPHRSASGPPSLPPHPMSGVPRVLGWAPGVACNVPFPHSLGGKQ